MRSQYNNTYPNTVRIAIGTFDDWKAGRVTLNPPGSAVSFATKNNAPVYNETDASVLNLGDPQLKNSASATIGWVHLFDYELDNNDILKDIKGEFQQEFVE